MKNCLVAVVQEVAQSPASCRFAGLNPSFPCEMLKCAWARYLNTSFPQCVRSAAALLSLATFNLSRWSVWFFCTVTPTKGIHNLTCFAVWWESEVCAYPPYCDTIVMLVRATNNKYHNDASNAKLKVTFYINNWRLIKTVSLSSH